MGPDFREEDKEPVERLARAYAAVLKLFVQEMQETGATELRLLPISGGEFAGKYGGQFGHLTAQALCSAIQMLEPQERQVLGSPQVKLKMCIFKAAEMGRFTQQWRRASIGICIDSPRVRMAEWRIRVEEEAVRDQVHEQGEDTPTSDAPRHHMDMPDYMELEREWTGTPEQADRAAAGAEEETPRAQVTGKVPYSFDRTRGKNDAPLHVSQRERVASYKSARALTTSNSWRRRRISKPRL